MSELAFSVEKGAPPVARVSACLEVLASVKLGDDPGPLAELWRVLVERLDTELRCCHDNVRWGGAIRGGPASTDNKVVSAFAATTGRGPDAGATDWAWTTFTDTACPDDAPRYTATCSLGWVSAAHEPRGISLRVTAPASQETWVELVRTARILATNAAAWRWMTVGYRYVTVAWQSEALADALAVVQRRSRRFIGVDVGDPLGLYTSDWQHRLRTVGFFTALSRDWLGAERRRDLLAAAAAAAVPASQCDEHIFLKTGAAPQLIDVNQREPHLSYSAVDRILGVLRASSGIDFLAPWTGQTTKAWLDRLQDEL